MTKIYESPDGGKTVYERESGSTARTQVDTSHDGHEWSLTELDDTIGVLTASSSNIYTSAIATDNVYSFRSAPTATDITIHDENGKEYSFRNMFDRLDTIEKRLTILRPDDKMLEKYELLQSLYDQYKAAEALLYGDDNGSND